MRRSSLEFGASCAEIARFGIALDKVAVMGQSCGGFLSITIGAEPRVKTIGVFNSGVQKPVPGAPASPAPGPDALVKLHGPVLLINGSEPDFMMAQSAGTFDLIDHLPAFYGARHNAGHTATVFHPRRRRIRQCCVELGLSGRSRAPGKPVPCSPARIAVFARIPTGM